MARRLLGLSAVSTIGVIGAALGACGSAPTRPAAPLREAGGAPACGNIGQAGQPHADVAAAPAPTGFATADPRDPLSAPAVEVRAAAELRRVAIERALVVPAAVFGMIRIARPLMIGSEPACGNAMSKGGGDKPC